MVVIDRLDVNVLNTPCTAGKLKAIEEQGEQPLTLTV